MRFVLIICFITIYLSCENKLEINTIVQKEETQRLIKTKGKLVCDNLKVEFGDIKKGGVLVQDFEFFNKGTEMIEVLGYEKSCNCTDLKISTNTIKPNEKTIITMMVETKNKTLGEHLVNVTLKTNGERTFYLLSANFNLIE